MEQLMQIMTGRPGIDVILLNTGTAISDGISIRTEKLEKDS